MGFKVSWTALPHLLDSLPNPVPTEGGAGRGDLQGEGENPIEDPPSLQRLEMDRTGRACIEPM